MDSWLIKIASILGLLTLSFVEIPSARAQCLTTPQLRDCSPTQDCGTGPPPKNCKICLVLNPITGKCISEKDDPACEADRAAALAAFNYQKAFCEARLAKEQSDCEAANGALKAAAARCEANPDQPLSPKGLWDHNGSTVYLKADGSKREFFYETPRAALKSIGVKKIRCSSVEQELEKFMMGWRLYLAANVKASRFRMKSKARFLTMSDK
jgi:hypothetical protein